jgi:acyl-CoA thioesterase
MKPEKIGYGICKLGFEVEKKFLNGFSIAHGGFLFSVADSAAAFAANSMGEVAVTRGAEVRFKRPVMEGSRLLAEAFILDRRGRFGWCDVKITDEVNVAFHARFEILFKGDVWKLDPRPDQESA